MAGASRPRTEARRLSYDPPVISAPILNSARKNSTCGDNDVAHSLPLSWDFDPKSSECGYFFGGSAAFFLDRPFVTDSKSSRYSGGGGRRTEPMPSPPCFSLFVSSRR